MSVATKALSAERNEHLRQLVRQLLTDIGGNQSDLARAMKLQPGQISEFLSARKGAGPSLLTAIAAYSGKSLDELMTGAPSVATAGSSPLDTPAARARAAAIALGYSTAAIEAGLREVAGTADADDAWETLGAIRAANRKQAPARQPGKFPEDTTHGPAGSTDVQTPPVVDVKPAAVEKPRRAK